MTRDQFFAWAEAQERRYEFDGLQPVLITGGSARHSRITINIISQLRNRLRGKPRQPYGPDGGVATVGNAVRYPETVVTCTRFDERERLVPNPVVVFEVVSPPSIRTDRVEKLHEYAAVPSIRRYVIVEQAVAAVTVYSRVGGDGAFHADGLAGDKVLALPEIGIEVPLPGIYEDVVFDTTEG